MQMIYLQELKKRVGLIENLVVFLCQFGASATSEQHRAILPDSNLRSLNALCYKVSSLPFKGRARVGMGCYCRYYPIPIPAFPLKGKGFRWLLTVS